MYITNACYNIIVNVPAAYPICSLNPTIIRILYSTILLQVFYLNKIATITNYMHLKSCIWDHFYTCKNKTSHRFWGTAPTDPLLQRFTTKLASRSLCPPFQKSRSTPDNYHDTS